MKTKTIPFNNGYILVDLEAKKFIHNDSIFSDGIIGKLSTEDSKFIYLFVEDKQIVSRLKETCFKILAAYPAINGIDEFETLPPNKQYSIKYHKEGDSVIRIYNSEGHVFCMYPYHLGVEAELHLQRLNSPNTEDDVEKLANGKYKYCSKDNLDKITIDEIRNYKNGFIAGYKQAKSETGFSLDNMKKSMFEVYKNGLREPKDGKENFNEIYNRVIRTLTKPKEYEFVPEMEEVD